MKKLITLLTIGLLFITGCGPSDQPAKLYSAVFQAKVPRPTPPNVLLPVPKGKTIIVGTGSGGFVFDCKNGAANPGDTLKFKAGTYTKEIDIFNPNGLIVDASDAILKAMVGTNTTTNTKFNGFRFVDVPGICFNAGGKQRRVMWTNCSQVNCGTFIESSDKLYVTNTDSTSMKMYICAIDSLTQFKSGLILMGTYASLKDNEGFMDSVVFSRIKSDSTKGNGTYVRANIFRIDAFDWILRYKGVIVPQGDVGIFQTCGYGDFHNLTQDGGRGYWVRQWIGGPKGRVIRSRFWNIVGANTNNYGVLDIRNETEGWGSLCTGGNAEVYNITAINRGDLINYWASIIVVGDWAAPFKLTVYNCYGSNLNTHGKPPIVMWQGTQWNGYIDSGRNVYTNTPIVDPVTFAPIKSKDSLLLGKGLIVPWLISDIDYNSRKGRNDIGAAQAFTEADPLPSDPSVPAPCNPVYIHDTFKLTVHDTVPKPYPVPGPVVIVHDTVAAKIKKTVVYFENGTIQ